MNTYILALWGAIAGTIGTVGSLYSVWLTRRKSISNGKITEGYFIEPCYAPFGLQLRFNIAIANVGHIPITIKGFELVVDKRFSEQLKSMASHPSVEKSDAIKLDYDYNTDEYRPDGRKKSNFDKPLRLDPSQHQGGITLFYGVLWADEKDGKLMHKKVLEPFEKGKYQIRAILSNNTKIKYNGELFSFVKSNV
ncbi:MAG: hypothetical protein FD122_3302 [Stygiobacter sp.]|nr:MAG: hypothetical protein FD122_3302 [Stygiobacter sp.]KAF0210296.1 MAG: hypothetical protein FD178_3665 [Ignavibacteria bacterium]